MAVKFTNNAVSTLTAGISAGVTQFNVASNSGFPSLSGADHTYVTIGTEVIKVTAISGTTFTCIATSSAHANGDNVELRMTAELLDDFATDLEAMPKTGGVFTGNVQFGDNKVLGLGNNSASGSDLIIYHDGNHSYLNTSVGDLRLSTADVGSSVQILGSGETLAEFSDDGDVDLFHNGVLKFSTTATGINVVGNLVLSGTVDGIDIQTLNSAVNANTAKTGITSSQASAITANTAKVGITSAQATAISNNTAKTGITSGQAAAIVLNTAKTGITSGQASAITANTAKTGITSAQTNAIVANTAKTGITSGQTNAITANTAKVTNATHTGDVTGSGALTIGSVKVATGMIQNNAITTDKIVNDAVTTAKLNLISTSSVPSIEAKSDGTTDGYIQLNCSANSHGIKLKSPPHSAGASYTLTFPNNDGNSGQFLKTDGSGVMSWDTAGSTSASDLTSGTLPMARLSGTLPALNGSNLTNLPSGSDSTKMPLAGGAFTGAVTTNSTIDGRDVNADGVLATNALPKGGGTMTGDLIFGDGIKLELGSAVGGDLEIYHSGSQSIINDTGTGNLQIRGNNISLGTSDNSENYIQMIQNSTVKLYHDGNEKLSTTSSGITVTGAIAVTGTVDGVDIQTLNTTASAALPKAGGTMTGEVTFTDNLKLNFGTGDDGEIYSDGTNLIVEGQGGTSEVRILSDDRIIIGSKGWGETFATFNDDGAVQLYYDGNIKLETVSGGVNITGFINPSGGLAGNLISANSVDSNNYVDGSIDSVHLATDSVTEAKMASNSVDSTSYVDGSIDTAHYSDNSVTNAKLASNSVDSPQYVDGSIDSAHLANNSVGSSAIQTNSVTSDEIADSTITATQLASNCVDSSELVAGAVDREHLSNSLGDLRKGITDIGRDGNDYLSIGTSAFNWYLDGSNDMRLENDGDLHCEGNVIAYSSTISDERLKHDIEPITDALSKVNQLNGVTFTYNADDKKSAGLIAQDVEKVLPSAVSEKKLPLKVDDGNEYKVLQYDQTIGLLVEAIKELTAKVELLENK